MGRSTAGILDADSVLGGIIGLGSRGQEGSL